MEKMKFRRRSENNSLTLNKRKEHGTANTSANLDSPTLSAGGGGTGVESGVNEWADVTVNCGDHAWHLHREVLKARSPWFRERIESEERRAAQEVSWSFCTVFGPSELVRHTFNLFIRHPLPRN